MRHHFLLSYAFTALLFASFTIAARQAATSFCKCICFNNSTIIALNPPRPSSSTSAPFPTATKLAREAITEDHTRHLSSRASSESHKLTCADCNRAFCLSYNLPICKDATDADVYTTCFQRDSLKDEIVIYIFLVLTSGLLAWAAVRPCVERFVPGFNMMRSGEDGGDRGREYVPLGRSRRDGLETDPGTDMGGGSGRSGG